MSEHKYTIAKTKEICKKKFGRLPKIGYEMEVETGVRENTLTDLNGRRVPGNYRYAIYLQNVSGTYRVWEWNDVFPTVEPVYSK